FMRLGGAERRRTLVPYVHVRREQMAEPARRGAKAEILLDPVVAAQRSGVERADRVETCTAKIDARTAGQNHVDGFAWVGASEQRVQRGNLVSARQGVVHARTGITGDSPAAR